MAIGGRNHSNTASDGIHHDPAAVCPHCGYNLIPERPVTRGALAFDPAGNTYWRGNLVRLTPHERLLLGSLVAADGGYLATSVLYDRMGSECLNISQIVHIITHRVRQKTEHDLIESSWGRGYRLNVEYLEVA